MSSTRISARQSSTRGRRASLPLRLAAGLCIVLPAAACSEPCEPTPLPPPTVGAGVEIPADPAPAAEPPAPKAKGSLPAVLVGTWNGGPGDSSESWLTFRTDGTFVWTWDGFLLSNGV